MSDLSTFKEILAAQLSAYRDATSILFNSLNQRLEDQNKTIYDLKRSLEFSQEELRDTRKELEVCKKELTLHNDDIVAHKQALKTLNEQIARQEDHSRKRNLRFDGIVESVRETWEQTQEKVSKIIKEKMKLENIEIEYAHRIRKSDKNQSSRGPRTIIARLKHDADRDSVIKNSKKLKGTDIFVNEDLSELTIQKRREKLPLLKAARNEGKIAYFIKDNLIIKERNLSHAVSDHLVTPSRGHVSSLAAVFSPHTPEVQSQTFNTTVAAMDTNAPQRDSIENLNVTNVTVRKNNKINK